MADHIGGENLADNVSELSSFSDSSDEGKRIEEVIPIAEEEADKPAYSDEDLDTLVGFMRNMIFLFDYDSNDFNDEVAEVIKLWLIDVNYPLLFIYYDGHLLAASLTFPKCSFNDLMYFMREPDQLFNVIETFHDDLMFGTLHNDIEGSLLVTLEQVYGPLMLSNTEWSENVKAHVLVAYNTFMTFLTDIHHKLSGFTLLYIPREGSDMDVQEVVLNRTTIKRLEAVVIEWTSQIRSTINDTQHSVPDDLICPSDEYNFWIYRHEVLSAIQSQFKNVNVLHILEILDLAQSLYTKPLRDVLNDLMIEIEIAEANIPFIKLLVDPCFAIRTLDNEDDLCSQLIYVMHIIRFIGEDSSHLRQDECITKLFLYLSNEIVSCCMQSIDVDKILSGSPSYGIEVCNIKINCCESYKIIYEEMIEHFQDVYAWRLDYAVIFNRIDAFMQRLYDMLEICHAMTIFAKHGDGNSYKNYRFSCNNAKMYENKCNQVEAIFATGIEKIQAVAGSILDINNKEWYTSIANFREMLKNLDDIIENLLSNVFLVADNLEEKINVLITILNFYKRESIRESFMRKISDIWNAFKEELTNLSKTVSSGINNYPTLFPKKSGQFALLKIKFERINRLKDLLERCRFFPLYSETDEILTLFESCEKQVKVALKSYNDLWIKSVSVDLGSWYHRHLICRSQIRPGLLECHIERRMLDIFEEAYFFKVSGAIVPSVIDMERNDNVKLTFDNVIRIILYFNNVISSISDKERLFFKPMIQQTERKLEPLKIKLTWEEDLGEYIDTFVTNVKDLLDVIQVYKKENLTIATWMENIYNILLFKLNHDKAQQLPDFMGDIKNQKRESISELVRLYSEISKHIFCIYETLGSNIRKMSESWAQYVHKIDHLLKAAVFNSSLNTLENILMALQKEAAPILSIELILNKYGITYQPSLESIETALKRLPNEVTSIIKIIPSMCQRFQIDSRCNFYDDFLQDSKFETIENAIHSNIKHTVEELCDFREKWGVFRPFWIINRKAFIDKFKLSSMTSEAFQKNNEKFEELLNQLATQRDSTVCKCVEVDAMKLKLAITNHINDWQIKYIEYLKCVAYGQIIDFHQMLKHNMEALSVEPKEVEDLKTLEKTYQSCFDSIPALKEEIGTIIKYFNVLEKSVSDLLPEAYQLRRNIHSNWQQYTDFLSKVKDQIENYQNLFKLSMANDVADLKVDAIEMLKMLDDQLPINKEILPEEAFITIDLLIKRLEFLEAQERNIEKKIRLLGIDYHPLDVIMEIRYKLESMKLIWKFVEQWNIIKKQIIFQKYEPMNVEEISKNICLVTCELQQLDNILKTELTYPILQATKAEFENVHVTFSIMVDMKRSHMRERHWTEIILMTNFTHEIAALISIKEAVNYGLHCHEERMSQLCLTARKEFEIETELEMVENAARTIRFDVQQKPNAEHEIIEAHTLSTVFKSNLIVINRLLQSPYRKPFQEKIYCWEKDLNFMNDLLETLISISDQSNTLYEISNATLSSPKLNNFNKAFKICYDKWTDLIEFIQKASLLLDICPHGASFLNDVELLRKRFYEVTLNLKQMLEDQRNNCYRLFLVPDKLLIKLFAFPNDYSLVQTSLVYIFENIKSLKIRQLDLPQKYGNVWEIDGLNTIDEDNIAFNKSILVEPGNDISNIMNRLESSVFDAIRVALQKCFIKLKQNYFKRFESGWLEQSICQVLIKCTQMESTHHIRNAIIQTNLLGKFKPLKMLKAMHDKLLNQLLTVKQDLATIPTLSLRRKLESILIVEINIRDVIKAIIKAKVSSLSTFEWVSQIRSYWNDEAKHCSVAQLNNEFAYGYELKKCDDPIFITPQTNRMMMTITTMIKSKYIPQLFDNDTNYGHHLLKQLAKEIAVMFVTLYCNSSWLKTEITKYMEGVMKLQAWICFKNIEKLSSQVLSAINDIIRNIFVQKSKRTTLNLKNTKTSSQFHIFAVSQKCMIPLPVVERSIMRPMSITIPDQTIVFENLLCLCGYKQYKKLASLLILFHEYIQTSISSQSQLWTYHRMEKAILKSRKLMAMDSSQEKVEIGCALQNEFCRSLSVAEASCFMSYLEALFYNDKREVGSLEVKQINVQNDFCSLNLMHSSYLKTKTKQILDAFKTYSQIIITGAVCSGKSSLISLVLQNLSQEGMHFKQYYVHPMTLNETHDINSSEDNTVSGILKSILQSKTYKQKCVIFDGPLCDSWLENIAFDRSCVRSDSLNISDEENVVKFVIETVDLQCATPAYVSSFSIIYIQDGNLTYRQLLFTWLETKKWPTYMKDELLNLIEKYIGVFINFKHQECTLTAVYTDVAVLHTFCALYENVFIEWNNKKIYDNEALIKEAIKKLFIFCCVWSVGGLMSEMERLKYDIFVRELVSDSTSSFPLKGTVFQYYVNTTNDACIWEQWIMDMNEPSSEFVCTLENKPYHYIMTLLLKDKKPALLSSDTTVGKSILIKNITTAANGSHSNLCISNLNEKTTIKSLRRILVRHSMKVSREIVYPKNRKYLTWFIDDMHNAAVHRLEVSEFLRRLLEQHSWDENNHIQCIKQTNIVAAMRNPVILGKHGTSFTRLLNKFHLFFYSKHDDENSAFIFKRKVELVKIDGNLENLLSSIPSATVDLIRQLSERFPSTIVKPRYEFSLKTISRIINIFCTMSQKTILNNSTDLIRLWINECYRETFDLLNRRDYGAFYEICNNTMLKYFDASLHGLCPGNLSPIFCDVDVMSQDATYHHITEVDCLRQQMDACLGPNTETTLFYDAIEHVSRVSRIFKATAHIALVGNVGSGRETICKIAAQVVEDTSFKILDIQSNTKDEIIDLKLGEIFECCKYNQTLCVVRIDHFAEINSSLLDIINSIIVNGTISGYYPCSRNSRNNMEETTWLQIRRNLHFALLVPMEKHQYWKIHQTYPSMMSIITKNCVQCMTEKSLHEISETFFKKKIVFDVPIMEESTNETPRSKLIRKRESLVQSTEERMQIAMSEAATRIHSVVTQELKNSNRNSHILDSWYFELLYTFTRIFHNKRNEIAKNFKKFSNGIRRIKEATESVANLKIDLEKQQEKITVYQQELNEFINNIQAQTASADLQNQEVAEKRVKIGAEEIICKELAAIAETDLNKAMPALNSAIAALDSLNKKDMNEIKSYARPPVKVELVLNAVMILLGKEPTWTEAKRQLGEQKFLDTLKNYDKNNIPESTLKTIGGFVRNPELEPNKVGVVSRAAKSLMLWVRAIENYGKVYKYVGPKIKRMEDATNSLREKQQSLREAEQRLTELAEQLSLLRKEYEIKMQSKFELEENAKAMAIKLKRSETLIDGLSEENSRWKNTAEELKSQYDQLIGNSVIVAASLVYFGCITPATRESLKSQWMVDLEALEISFTANCSTFSYFYSNEILQTWCSLGLPNDGLTVENATILLNSNLRSPLVVDPQGEIRRWLVQQDTNLISYNLDEERILSQVEEFAQSHQHIIAVNLREANINHFSQLQTYHKTYHSNKSGTKQYDSALVVITTEEIPYHNKLKKTANVINFILDKSGLEVKLLVTIIKHENPSLEERKEALEQMIISSNETITNLEENILRILNHSQLPLIENEELYGTLQVSKQTASSVKENLKHAALTKTEIESSRDIYRSCATRASLLFFILEDLKHVNAAYRFKLEWYILLFIESLEKSGREQNIEERKKKIINHHTFNLFRYVRCALSLSDQTIFAFHLCVRVLLEEEVLTAREFLFFLNGADKIDRHEQIENPNPDWIKPALWDNITELDKLPGFRGIAQSFDEINATWKTWCLSEFPEEETLPESWDRNLTLFQKYTLVRSVRLDRTVPCMKSFVATYQGKRFIDDNSSTLHDLLSISDPATPIILISDDENKPLEEVHNLHKIYNGKSNKTLQHVNMGTESFETTVKHLKNCVKSQNWLYLNQCWQSRQFLANFELIHQYLRTIDQKSGFRLWIVMHNRKTLFPVHVLHNCLKYRCSFPTGIKHNMKLIFEQIGDNFRKTEKSKHSLNYNKLIFALAFFHALLNERNKYLSLGWNMQYNFTIMDFKLSESLMAYSFDKLMEPKYKKNIQTLPSSSIIDSSIIPSADGDDVLWSFVKNAVLQVGYGTNFTDTWDQRIFDAYCTNIFRRELIELSQCALVPDDDTPYQIPRNVNFTSYLNFIVSQFPQEDGNKVFGQNENANIIYLESCSAYALQKLRLMQLQGKISSHGQQFDVTNLDKAKKLIMELLIVVPECLDYENVQRIVESKKTHVNLCLMQETYQYNLTLEIVRQSLEKTSEMLSGVITITSELLDFLQDLQRNRIPQAWISQLSLSYSTDKNVSDWIIELKHRVNHLRKWAETGQLSTDVTLGFFLNPKLFIHSVMRIHSDAYNIPLHDLTWEVSVSQTAKPVLRIPIENGFIGRGFYLYNGGWDIQDQCLVVPKILQLIHRMPPMMFKPTRKINTENKTGFQCPCYYSSKKEKSSFIMEIDLNPGNNEKSTWIKMNTCMLLNES